MRSITFVEQPESASTRHHHTVNHARVAAALPSVIGGPGSDSAVRRPRAAVERADEFHLSVGLASDIEPIGVAVETSGIPVHPSDGAADLVGENHQVAADILYAGEVGNDIMRPGGEEHFGRSCKFLRAPAAPQPRRELNCRRLIGVVIVPWLVQSGTAPVTLANPRRLLFSGMIVAQTGVAFQYRYHRGITHPRRSSRRPSPRS
jgi:hypothetical protein